MRHLTVKYSLFSIAIVAVLFIGMGRTSSAAPLLPAISDQATASPAGVITMPDPTGPYKIGRVGYEWVDQSRSEIYASNPDLKRDLMVNIWFPADPAKRAKVAPYMGDSTTWTLVTKHPELDGTVHAHAYNTKAVAADKP